MVKKRLMFAALAGAVSSAHAGFFLVDKPAEPEKAKVAVSQAPVKETQAKPTDASPAKPPMVEKPTATSSVYVEGELVNAPAAIGYGKRVPLHVALRQIAPRDYSVNTTGLPEETASERVDWKGGEGKNWAETLRAVIDGRNLLARIDTKYKTVVVQLQDDVRAGSGATWRIKAGDRVSEALSNWSRRAGWSAVVWEAPDVVAEMDIVFTGDFVGAVTQTIEALAHSGTPVRAIVYEGNKVIRVMEKR